MLITKREHLLKDGISILEGVIVHAKLAELGVHLVQLLRHILHFGLLQHRQGRGALVPVHLLKKPESLRMHGGLEAT